MMALRSVFFPGEQAWAMADAHSTSWHPQKLPTTPLRDTLSLSLTFPSYQCRGGAALSKPPSPNSSIFASKPSPTEAPPRRFRSQASAEPDNPTPEEDDDKPFSIRGDLQVEYESEVVRREMAKLWEVWWKRGWAPWEALLAPENEFAMDKLIGPDKRRSRWESFRKVHPPARAELIEVRKQVVEKQFQAQIDEFVEMREKAIEMKESLWEKPLVFALIPPRDWPPPGWRVDAKELAYIREAYKLEAVRFSSKDLENAIDDEEAEVSVDRWRMFMKQYDEWAAANKAILDKESLESDLQYVPGRRRTGKNYEEGMYELPFVYPGQHYWGVVTCIHLYQGAFVHFGAVHDGLVQARLNDWYYLRKYIKVGMRVHVEVIAKRDPYRYRFPIELRFVEPNVDKFIFNRFEYPPIFQRPGDNNLDEVARETKRPYIPVSRPKRKPMKSADTLVHPCNAKVWKVHQAEQMLLDAEEDPNSVLTSDDDIFKKKHEDDDESERPDCVWTKEVFNGRTIPTLMVRVDESELDLDAARAERQALKKMFQEAEAKGEQFAEPKLRKDGWMEALNQMHRRRAKAELNALRRDITSRKEFGLPIEEPGRYVDSPYKGNVYNPRDKLWSKDYLGDLSKQRYEPKYMTNRRRYATKSSRKFPGKKRSKVEVKSPSKVPDKAEEIPKKKAVTGGTYILQDGDSSKNEHWYVSEDDDNETLSGSKNWIDVHITSKSGEPLVFDEVGGMYENSQEDTDEVMDEDEDENEDWDEDEIEDEAEFEDDKEDDDNNDDNEEENDNREDNA